MPGTRRIAIRIDEATGKPLLEKLRLGLKPSDPVLYPGEAIEVPADHSTVKTRLMYQQLVVLGPDEDAPQPRPPVEPSPTDPSLLE